MNPLQSFTRGTHKYLVPYLTAGYPDRDQFLRLAQMVADAGADALEIGIPFSDPVADGPVIQQTGQAALDQGIDTLQEVARLTEAVAIRVDIPVLWMGYLNPFLKTGIKRAVEMGGNAGVRGWIIPDLPFEEAEEALTAIHAAEGVWIPLLTSTTSTQRAAAMLALSRSFAYYVAIAGITGARDRYPEGWDHPLAGFRELGPQPSLVGFGVSSPTLAQECARVSEGVIVGSALLQHVLLEPNNSGIDKAAAFVATLRRALDS